MVNCRVLDPFSGTGTTLKVADELGRDATGIDLKSDDNAISVRRTATPYHAVTTDGNGQTTLERRDLFSVLAEAGGL